MSLATLLFYLLSQGTTVYQCPLPNGKLTIMYPKEDFNMTYIAESVGTSWKYDFVTKKGIVSAWVFDTTGPARIQATALETKESVDYKFPDALNTKNQEALKARKSLYEDVKRSIANFKKWYREWLQQQSKGR